MATLDGLIALITGTNPSIGAAAFRLVTETSQA
jgi:hypothetical protein